MDERRGIHNQASMRRGPKMVKAMRLKSITIIPNSNLVRKHNLYWNQMKREGNR